MLALAELALLGNKAGQVASYFVPGDSFLNFVPRTSVASGLGPRFSKPGLDSRSLLLRDLQLLRRPEGDVKPSGERERQPKVAQCSLMLIE
ncbi:MAG: hypothetical protein J2P17_19230 [Mycobacterium sp.]|nr:hypothetical protein [Mycobacterium sp.]